MPVVEAALADGVYTVALNRPPVNVLDIATMRELTAALAGAPDEARVVALSAEGKAFCAGVDVADHTAERVAEMLSAFDEVEAALSRVPVPTVALVGGAALGGGCELALSADIVAASDRATFGQPEIKLGVFPPLAAARYPRRFGRSVTCDLVLTGRTLNAEEALHVGLVSRVFPAERFDKECGALLASIARNSRAALTLAKRAIGLGERSEDALGAVDALYLNELMATEDAAEGLAAFIKKRKPVWKHR